MGNTSEGAKKCSDKRIATIRKKYGNDFFHKVGLLGGSPILLDWRNKKLELEKESKKDKS